MNHESFNVSCINIYRHIGTNWNFVCIYLITQIIFGYKISYDSTVILKMTRIYGKELI